MKHPFLFNPYTGARRDVRDIDSDPAGVLIVPPDAEVTADTMRLLRERTDRADALNEAVHTFSFQRSGPYLVRAMCACGWVEGASTEAVARAAHRVHMGVKP